MNNMEFPETSTARDDSKQFAVHYDAKLLLESLLANDHDCIYFKDRQGRFIKVSPAHAKLFGIDDPEEAVGKTDFDFFDEKEARKFFDGEKQIIATGEPMKNVEEMDTFPDGTVTWFSTTKVAMYDSTGTAVGIVGISRDISEKKLQERHFQQVTRLYAAMSQMYHAMLLTRSRKSLFSEVCRSLVEYAQFKMAWIGLVNPGNQHIKLAAKFGDTVDFLQRVQAVGHDKWPDGLGPTKAALCEGTTQVVNNIQVIPGASLWQAEAKKSGFHSCASIPLHIANKVVGALTVYSNVSGFFSDKETILLDRAAADISSTLELIDAYVDLHH